MAMTLKVILFAVIIINKKPSNSVVTNKYEGLILKIVDELFFDIPIS